MSKNLFFDEPEKRVEIKVCFRVDKNWPDVVTAVFLDTFPIECYAHIGQHSTCVEAWVRDTKECKDPEKVYELYAELESIGYDVKAVHRMAYPDPAKICCPKCGCRFKPNEWEYNEWCQNEARNLRQSFTNLSKLKRMSLKQWGLKNHVCKTKKK